MSGAAAKSPIALAIAPAAGAVRYHRPAARPLAPWRAGVADAREGVTMGGARWEAVRLEPGRTLRFDELPERSVALDGAILGRHLDPVGYRFSFDHHEEPRFGLLSTCEQVCEAVELGLEPAHLETILANHLDRDVAASIWLLLNPGRAGAVRERVASLGRTDRHGPGAPGGVFTPQLGRFFTWGAAPAGRKELVRAVEAVGAWLEGHDEGGEIPPERDPACFAILCPSGESVPAPTGAAGLYDQEHVAFVLGAPLGEARWRYTYARRSDFVPYSFTRFLAAVARLEPGWGGSSTVGGSPRPAGSELPPGQLAALVREVGP